MKLGGFGVAMWLAVVLALLGCGAGGPPGGGAPGDPSARRTGVKRIAIGITVEPDFHPSASAPHHRFQPLVHSGLSIADDRGVLQPALAEALPTLENGLWKLLPDGRMETTWRLRPGARWHDGAPFTADDLRFTLEVGQDPGVAGFQNVNFRSIEAVATTDAHTLTLSWNAPFVDADRLFGADRGSRPLPRHRLGDVFQNNKSGFPDVPYWTQEYVGAGPYRIRDWNPGVTLTLEAHSGYALGRPRIDQIEVRIIPDASTIIGNVLSGAVDFTSQETINDTLAFMSLHSLRVRLASNGFRTAGLVNTSRYMNPEMDALVERYPTTAPLPERIQAIGEIIHHVADQVVVVGIYYAPAPVAVGERLVNFIPAGRGIIWNAHEWDIRGREG